MRRFLKTRTCRAICHLVATTLVLPFLSFMLASRAEAQVQVKPQWAVVPFVNQLPVNGGAKYSDIASQAVFDELTKTQAYDVQPLDSVRRSIESLGLQSPVTDPTSLLRIAQDLNVTTLVTGKLAGWEVDTVAGGKQAKAGIQVIVEDVASGLAVNGAAVIATSSVRASNTDQDTLVSEALAQAAAQAVQKIQSQVLPEATVLNTRNFEGLINRGARDGFLDGQFVIVTRGREQVATAKVFDVEPDSASIKIVSQTKGIQPGDRVRVVFTTSEISVGRGGQDLRVHKPPKPADSSAIISAGLVLGVVAFLLSGGRSNNNIAAEAVQAQATTFPPFSNNAVIQISWRLDSFYRNSNNVQWLIFRSDQGATPVQVQQNPNSTSVFDDPNPKTFTADTGEPQISPAITCVGLVGGGVTTLGLQLGAPYLYSVSGVYRVLGIDLPPGVAPSGTYCYFSSSASSASGFATALGAPTLETPLPDSSVTTFGPFTFTSLETAVATIPIGYVIQVSTSPQFPASKTVTSAEKVTQDTTDQSVSFTPRSSTDTFFAFLQSHFGASFTGGQVYWRVGARNVDDYPGPLPDPATGYRYIFCSPSQFTVANTAVPKKTAIKAQTKKATTVKVVKHISTIPSGSKGKPQANGNGKGN